MVIIGLDLSITSTGFSVVKFDKKIKVIDYGKIETKPKDFKSEDERINYIVDEIKLIINKHKKIDCVGIENQFISARTNTIMVLRKLMGAVCRMVFSECGIEIYYIAPTSVKKCITGSGKAKKDDVANTIRDKYIDIGEYSNKTGKSKTSDIYDSIGVAISIYERFLSDKGE